MDFTSNDFVLAVTAVIVVVLIRTLILASKEINSSDKFPNSNNCEENKEDNENLPWAKSRFNPFGYCGFSLFINFFDGASPENLSFHFI